MAGSLDLIRFNRALFDTLCSEERVADYFSQRQGDVLGSLHRPYDATNLVVAAFGNSYQLEICELSQAQWREVLESAKALDSEVPERVMEFVTLLTDVLATFDFEQNTLTFCFCH